MSDKKQAFDQKLREALTAYGLTAGNVDGFVSYFQETWLNEDCVIDEKTFGKNSDEGYVNLTVGPIVGNKNVKDVYATVSGAAIDLIRLYNVSFSLSVNTNTDE